LIPYDFTISECCAFRNIAKCADGHAVCDPGHGIPKPPPKSTQNGAKIVQNRPRHDLANLRNRPRHDLANLKIVQIRPRHPPKSTSTRPRQVRNRQNPTPPRTRPSPKSTSTRSDLAKIRPRPPRFRPRDQIRPNLNPTSKSDLDIKIRHRNPISIKI